MTSRDSGARPPEVGDSFVIWLDDSLPGERQPGTVEHIGSATRLRFEDLSDLPEMIERALRNLPKRQP